MAQVDPNIAMGFRPVQIPLEESPLNRMQKYADYENALVKSQELQQQRQERNELARIMSDPNLEFGSDAFMQQVLKRVPSQYESIATRALQRESLAAQRETRQAEATKRKRELDRENFQTAVGELISYRTVEEVKTDIAAKEKAGVITPQQADVLRAKLPTDDTQLDSWRVDTMRGMLPPKEQLADIRAQQKDIREDARLKLEDARIQETQRHQRAMEDISKSGVDRQQKQLEETQRHNQAMEKLRLREINKPSAAPAPTVTMVLDPNDNTRMLSVDAKTYKGGSIGSPGVIGIAGKEPTVGKKQEAKEKAQENAATTIAQLRQSYARLDELGGITSTENRAGTNISARMGASSVGQTVGSFLGTKTQAERDKIEQTRPLLMTTIMQALGLTAKQLDSNAELKLWLSSATDPTKSLEANREALDNLERMLTGEGKGAGAGAKPPPAPKPKSDLFNAADAIIGKQP